MTKKPYDVIVFGATSFVGQLLCKYMVERFGTDDNLSWAIAGRNSSKLSSVAAETGATVDQIVADATDREALDELVSSTKVVVSTVGPYDLYGSDLVAAAVAGGIAYCDLTGETPWMAKMIEAHEEEAKRTGARIVHTCGFDSVPSDLGVWFTQQSALEATGAYCSEISMRVKALKGGASGGTVASMVNIVEEAASDPELRKMMANPYAIAPGGRDGGVKQKNVNKPTKDEASGSWIAPFVMAGVNVPVVLRTNGLLDHRWGKDFRYDEAMTTGDGPLGGAKSAALVGGMAVGMGLLAIGPTRKALAKFVLPKPGEGPSPKAQEEGFYDLRFYGKTADGKSITTKITGDRDPGYGSTSKILGECAALLAAVSLSGTAPSQGGFFTPASIFGDDLVQALTTHAGLTFDVI